MKKYLLLMVLLLVFTSIQAQTRADTLKQSKDYLNGKLTYLVLQQFVKDKPQYADTLQTISSSLQNISATNLLSYAALSSLLKGKFDKVLIKFCDPVNKIDINPFVSQSNEKATDSLVDTVFAVLSKNYPAFDAALQTNKSMLKDSVLLLLNKVHAQTLQPQQAVDNTSTNDTPPVQPINVTLIWLLLALLAAAIITISLLYNGRFKAVEKKLKELTDSQSQTANKIPNVAYTNAINTETQSRDIARFIDNNDAIKGFQKAIFDLQKRLSDLEQMQEKPASLKGALSAPLDPLSSSGKQNVVDEEVFYMTLPISNYFLVKSKSLTKDNTIYKFIVKPNKQEADFSVHISGSQLSDVLSVIESYIKPACDEENLPGSNVKNIITKQPGVAMLEGDKWIIKTKALIRYE